MIYEALYDYDDELRTQFGDLVCGTDEAGRGPLAGPVSCAAVILRAGDRFEWLNDSKKVTEKRREKLCDEIKSRCLFFSFVFIDNRVIDEINILWASMLGMSRAVEKLKAAPSLVLADGNRAPDCGKIETRCVVHGDAVSASIAAASIIAKVERDRFMRELDVRLPQYGFAQHKGYPTKAHYAAIDQFGITEYHRLSFLKGRV